MRLIVLVNQLHAVEVQEDEVGIPCQHLLHIDVERAGLVRGVCQVVGVNQLKGAVVCLGALKAMVSLEGHAAHIAAGFLVIGDGHGALLQILLNPQEVRSQCLCPVFQPVQLAQNPNGGVGLFVQGGVAAGNHHHGGSGFPAQLIGILLGVSAHHNDLRLHIDDFFHKRLAIGAGHRQILEPVKIYIVVQAAHAGLGFVVFHADHPVGTAHIAGVAQRTHAHADNPLDIGGNFHTSIHAVNNDPGFFGFGKDGYGADSHGKHHGQRQQHCEEFFHFFLPFLCFIHGAGLEHLAPHLRSELTLKSFYQIEAFFGSPLGGYNLLIIQEGIAAAFWSANAAFKKI